MRKVAWTKAFERSLKRAKRRSKDLNKLHRVLKLLGAGKPLPQKYRNHKLTGNYNGRWECHIEPDWLLIYVQTDTELILEITGSHADLFR